jgi:predicted amidophosphoribosyltransferase
MGILVFFLMAAVAAVAIAYPLLPGARTSQTVPAVTDGDIEEAVRRLRRGRKPQGQRGLSCPSCGRAYQAGDRFCVGCGSALPAVDAAAATCPSCGATLREGDQFCAKCGHNLLAEEVA